MRSGYGECAIFVNLGKELYKNKHSVWVSFFVKEDLKLRHSRNVNNVELLAVLTLISAGILELGNVFSFFCILEINKEK